MLTPCTSHMQSHAVCAVHPTRIINDIWSHTTFGPWCVHLTPPLFSAVNSLAGFLPPTPNSGSCHKMCRDLGLGEKVAWFGSPWFPSGCACCCWLFCCCWLSLFTLLVGWAAMQRRFLFKVLSDVLVCSCSTMSINYSHSSSSDARRVALPCFLT